MRATGHRFARVLGPVWIILVAVATMVLTAPQGPAHAGDTDTPAGQLPASEPASGTPNVLDGRVYAVAQVGDTILLGGTFTSAANAGSATSLVRNHLLAFSASTGQISTTFDPEPSGEVRAILPTGDGSTVYVGGGFTSIGGVARQRIARISVADGSVVSAFNPKISSEVRDLKLSNGRLWASGGFTSVGGHAQTALATLDPTTGAWLPYMWLAIAGQHRPGVGTTAVIKMDISPDGSRLVGIGNFDTLNGVTNHQIFMLDLSGATAQPAAFRTSFYTSLCSSSFDTYMRDVDFSPDGSYFVVGTTGAYGGSTSACDEVSRFETNAGSAATPSWTDYTGGDTTYTVEASDTAIFVGGHERWWNNPFAGDKAGAGAVSRPGIAALSPVSGLPFSWNPTRKLGVGVFDMLRTTQGLWVGSDTDTIGGLYRARIARMPAAGASFPAYRTPTLPGTVYSGGFTGLAGRSYDGTTAGAPQAAATGGISWGSVRGAFMLNGWLYLAMSDGSFTRRTFDGTSYGAPVPVNTADLLVTDSAWHTDVRNLTGLFYDRGRIYYTTAGSSQLSYRYFNPEDDVVGAKKLTSSSVVNGFSPAQVRGMFATGGQLYWATSDGNLRRMDWIQNAQSGVPSGTAQVVAGPALGGQSWAASSLFIGQGAAMPVPPATDDVTYVGSAGSNANTANQKVTIPAAVQAGDTLVLSMVANSTAVTITPPSGWTQLEWVNGSNVQGAAWTRTAVAGDAGSVVTLPASGTVKADLTLLVYRGINGKSSTVADHSSTLDETSSTVHNLPSVVVPAQGGWVVAYAGAKTSSDTTWTPPAGTVVRTGALGAGSGRITSLGVDSGAAVSGGPAAGGTLGTDPAVSRTLIFRFVIAAG